MAHDFQDLADRLIEAQRLESRVDLAEAIDTLKGDAVGRGRLQTGFFVEDLLKLCDRHLRQRGSAMFAAYESALKSCKPPLSTEITDAFRQGLREQVRVEALEVEDTFQRSLLTDHLPVVKPLADAAHRVASEMDARAQLLVAQLGSSEVRASARRTDTTTLSSADEILEIRPNVAGIGINIRALIRRLMAWRANRRASRGS